MINIQAKAHSNGPYNHKNNIYKKKGVKMAYYLKSYLLNTNFKKLYNPVKEILLYK